MYSAEHLIRGFFMLGAVRVLRRGKAGIANYVILYDDILCKIWT